VACRGGHLAVYLLVANIAQWGRYWYLHKLSVFYRTSTFSHEYKYNARYGNPSVCLSVESISVRDAVSHATSFRSVEFSMENGCRIHVKQSLISWWYTADPPRNCVASGHVYYFVLFHHSWIRSFPAVSAATQHVLSWQPGDTGVPARYM